MVHILAKLRGRVDIIPSNSQLDIKTVANVYRLKQQHVLPSARLLARSLACSFEPERKNCGKVVAQVAISGSRLHDWGACVMSPASF